MLRICMIAPGSYRRVSLSTCQGGMEFDQGELVSCSGKWQAGQSAPMTDTRHYGNRTWCRLDDIQGILLDYCRFTGWSDMVQ